MSARTSSKNRTRGLFLIAAVLFTLCILVAMAGYMYYRPAEETPLVMINDPQNGATFTAMELIPISASGFYIDGMARLELYVDGGLTAVQETTLLGGSNPLALAHEWLPLTTGRHLLTVRAYTEDDRIADSTVVMVDILPAPETLDVDLSSLRDPASGSCPSLAQILAESGISIERLLELNPGLPPAGTDAPLACDIRLTAPNAAGSNGSGAPGGTTPGGSGPAATDTGGGGSGITPPTPQTGSPAAPTGLNGSLTCTDANISWNVSTDATDGYALFFLAPGITSFQRLAFMSGETSTTFPISVLGDYRFQIASLRGGMEGLSPIVTFSTPGLCVPPAIAPGVTDLTISLISLETSEPFDGVYCYARVMDMPNVRLPRMDFSSMRPGADGLTYSIQHQLPNRGMFRVAIPEDGAVTLGMECWGYRGAESHSLGSFAASHFRDEWDARDLSVIQPSAITVASLDESPPRSGSMAEYSFRMIYRIAASTPSAMPGLLDPSLLPSLTPDMLAPVEGPGMNIPAPTNLRLNRGVGRLGLDIWSAELAWDWTGGSIFNERSITGYHVTIFARDIASGPRDGVYAIIWETDVTPGSHKFVTLPHLPAIFGCGNECNLM